MSMNLLSILIGLIVLIFSAILHELAHGYVADKLGDPTARLAGRLTLNPRPHIDLYMSILLPLLLIISRSPVIFGGAKPVPVDPFNLREGRKDIALVSLAGPLTNLVLAILATIGIHLLSKSSGSTPLTLLEFFLLTVVQINVSLAIFNLLPIPPLDGSKIAALLLPERMASQYLTIGRFGMMLIFFFLLFYGSFFDGLYQFALRLLGLY